MPSTTSADDIRHLAQLAIDLPALEKYFHPEVPGRKPLCVVHNQVFRDQPALTKFGQPVRYVTPAEAASGSPCVEFSRVEDIRKFCDRGVGLQGRRNSGDGPVPKDRRYLACGESHAGGDMSRDLRSQRQERRR